jgi:hypothetical protein
VGKSTSGMNNDAVSVVKLIPLPSKSIQSGCVSEICVAPFLVKSVVQSLLEQFSSKEAFNDEESHFKLQICGGTTTVSLP